MNVIVLQFAGQSRTGNLTFVLVAVIAAGKQDRRSIAVLDGHDRNEQRAPAAAVAGMRNPEMTDLFAVLVEIEVGGHARTLLGRHGPLPCYRRGNATTRRLR